MAYPENTASILLFMGHDFDCFDVVDNQGQIFIRNWTCSDPQPTEAEVLAQEKPWAGFLKKAEIDAEQVLRATNILMISDETLGFTMPRTVIDILEETYLHILKPAARNPVDEITTPFWWGIRELRNNRNTLLASLQNWIDNPLKTANDILSFDVTSWSGWAIERPIG